MANSEAQMHIVCAARGGRRIQPSVNRAIELACEADARLTFLYVLDVEFMKFTTLGRTDLVFEELDKMGEFMMIRLCEYANEGGCASADYSIRHGKIREEIVNYLKETRPDLLVLGRPQKELDHEAPPAFESDAIVEFAQDITQETGVKVELV
jgi:nucleotide-binding universal stress UspA family protein